ncbi:MAG: hypothetical protein Q4G26_10380 [Paracoccus sp. (in: a-proteobacteria)]|nr:hypothetical protein [Paracoccus sp. (in: a-proteobacteria)]
MPVPDHAPATSRNPASGGVHYRLILQDMAFAAAFVWRAPNAQIAGPFILERGQERGGPDALREWLAEIPAPVPPPQTQAELA